MTLKCFFLIATKRNRYLKLCQLPACQVKSSLIKWTKSWRTVVREIPGWSWEITLVGNHFSRRRTFSRNGLHWLFGKYFGKLEILFSRIKRLGLKWSQEIKHKRSPKEHRSLNNCANPWQLTFTCSNSTIDTL